MKKALTFILLIAVLASCKKEVTNKVDQDKIFTIFELSYNENTDLTTATAEFRFSSLLGTRLELSDGSSVAVNSQNMEWSEQTGNYGAEFSGLVPTAEFVWVDLDGNSFSNTAEIRDIDYPTTLPDYTFADSVSYFMWEGAALDTSESVYIELDGVGTTDTRRFSVDTIGATTITIDSVRLSEIDSGLVNMLLVKRYRPELLDGTSKGGQITGEYRPTDRTFNLE